MKFDDNSGGFERFWVWGSDLYVFYEIYSSIYIYIYIHTKYKINKFTHIFQVVSINVPDFLIN